MEYSTDPHTASSAAGGLDHHPAAALFPLLEVESEFGEMPGAHRCIRDEALP